MSFALNFPLCISLLRARFKHPRPLADDAHCPGHHVDPAYARQPPGHRRRQRRFVPSDHDMHGVDHQGEGSGRVAGLRLGEEKSCLQPKCCRNAVLSFSEKCDCGCSAQARHTRAGEGGAGNCTPEIFKNIMKTPKTFCCQVKQVAITFPPHPIISAGCEDFSKSEKIFDFFRTRL